MERRLEMLAPIRQAVFIDVDRTILRSESFSQYVYESLAEMGVPASVLARVAQKQAVSVHNAFDYISEVYREIGVDTMTDDGMQQVVDNIKRKYHHDGKWESEFVADILVADSQELVDGLSRANVQPVLCTSGGEMTQRIKLKILSDVMGVDFPWVIVGVDQQHKAAMLAQTYDAQARVFDLSSYADQAVASHGISSDELSSIESVYVIDDKWVNVTDIPDDIPVYGYLVYAAELPDDGAERLSLKEVKSQIP